MKITRLECGWYRAETEDPRMSVEGATPEIVGSIIGRFTPWYLEKKAAVPAPEPPKAGELVDASVRLEEKRIDDIYKEVYGEMTSSTVF